MSLVPDRLEADIMNNHKTSFVALAVAAVLLLGATSAWATAPTQEDHFIGWDAHLGTCDATLQLCERGEGDVRFTTFYRRRSFEQARIAVETTCAGDLDRQVWDNGTTARGVLLRLVVHVGEHLGQLIAYGRVNGVVPLWSR